MLKIMYREIMIYDAFRNNSFENIFLFPVTVVFFGCGQDLCIVNAWVFVS